MMPFDELQREHERLLEGADAIELAAITAYIDRARAQSAQIGDPRERDQLRANLRYWASVAYDRSGTYPTTTLLPAAIAKTIAPPLPEPDNAAPVAAPRPIWLMVIAAGAMLVVVVLALMLVQPRTASPQITPAPLPVDKPTAISVSPTPTLPSNELPIDLTATMAAAAGGDEPTVPAPLSTATPLPTATFAPAATATPVPAATATPAPAPTATAVVPIFIRLTPQLPQPPSQNVPLQVGFQIITFGPSPFNASAWVIQIQLLAAGGDNHYVFWADDQRLEGDRYTISGVACRAVTFTIGATSGGQAVLREITLPSPLTTCR